MDNEYFKSVMTSRGDKDYEIYLRTAELHRCQKPAEELCNGDELMFQIVHQVEELWAKLIVYTALQVEDEMRRHNTPVLMTYLTRLHNAMRKMCEAMDILETMSPKGYQEIRARLGNGSGSESPGFRAIVKVAKPLLEVFKRSYLEPAHLTLSDLYDTKYDHGETFVVAEGLITFDELFQRFRYNHLKLVQRTIGIGTSSIKGRPVDMLEDTTRSQFYPELWSVRHDMTEAWGASYGVVRPSLTDSATRPAAPLASATKPSGDVVAKP